MDIQASQHYPVPTKPKLPEQVRSNLRIRHYSIRTEEAYINWIKKYGQNLLCVRYKYDQNTQKKMITVELVADMQEWHKDLRRIPKNKIVPLKIKFGEVDLGIRVRALGGTWNREKKYGSFPSELFRR